MAVQGHITEVMISDTAWQQTDISNLARIRFETVLEGKLRRSWSDPVGRKKGYILNAISLGWEDKRTTNTGTPVMCTLQEIY